MGKNEKIVISDYFRELPEYKKVKFRERVKDELEISQSVFYSRMRDDDWKKIEKETVLKIIETNDYARENRIL